MAWARCCSCCSPFPWRWVSDTSAGSRVDLTGLRRVKRNLPRHKLRILRSPQRTPLPRRHRRRQGWKTQAARRPTVLPPPRRRRRPIRPPRLRRLPHRPAIPAAPALRLQQLQFLPHRRPTQAQHRPNLPTRLPRRQPRSSTPAKLRIKIRPRNLQRPNRLMPGQQLWPSPARPGRQTQLQMPRDTFTGAACARIAIAACAN